MKKANGTVILIVTTVCLALILIVVLTGSYHKKDKLIVLQNAVIGNPPENNGIYISPGFSCGDESNFDCSIRAQKCKESGKEDCPQTPSKNVNDWSLIFVI